MSYNSQVESFVIGDLVYFTGYNAIHEAERNHLGRVVGVGNQSRTFRTYEVIWLQSNLTVSVDAAHLKLAYVRKNHSS